MNELEKIQKDFLWKNSTFKIKHETLFNDYKAGGLKNVDILNKITALQGSWIRTPHNNCFIKWKLILLYLLKNHLALHLNFIQINILKVIKPSFSHNAIGNLFWTGKKILL